MSKKKCMPGLLGAGLLTSVLSCTPQNRAEIAAMKAETEKLIEEQRNVAGETSALASQLDVLGRSASRVEDATGALKDKIARLKRQLAALEAGDRSIQQQTLDLKAEHDAYRKRNPLN